MRHARRPAQAARLRGGGSGGAAAPARSLAKFPAINTTHSVRKQRGFLGSDYDSDDNSTAAQVHRFFAKVEGLGIDLGEDMFSDPWA